MFVWLISVTPGTDKNSATHIAFSGTNIYTNQTGCMNNFKRQCYVPKQGHLKIRHGRDNGISKDARVTILKMKYSLYAEYISWSVDVPKGLH